MVEDSPTRAGADRRPCTRLKCPMLCLILGEDVTNFCAAHGAQSAPVRAPDSRFEVAEKLHIPSMAGRRSAGSGAGRKRGRSSLRRLARRGWMMSPPTRTGPRPTTWRGWASPSLMRLTRLRRRVSDLPDELQELAGTIAGALKGASTTTGDFRTRVAGASP